MRLKLNIKEEHLESLVKLLDSSGVLQPKEPIEFTNPGYPSNIVEVLVTYDEYILIKDYEQEHMSSNDC